MLVTREEINRYGESTMVETFETLPETTIGALFLLGEISTITFGRHDETSIRWTLVSK